MPYLYTPGNGEEPRLFEDHAEMVLHAAAALLQSTCPGYDGNRLKLTENERKDLLEEALLRLARSRLDYAVVGRLLAFYGQLAIPNLDEPLKQAGDRVRATLDLLDHDAQHAPVAAA